MGKLSSYTTYTSTPADTDSIPMLVGGVNKQVPVPNLVRQPYITVGPTGSFANYVCDGTADNVEILQAINATSGKAFIKNGTYNISGRMLFSKGNLEIEGEERGSTIIKATSSIYDSGQNQHYGIFTIKNHTGAISNISFKNLTIDCNNQLKTQAVTITGGTTYGVASTSKIRFENVYFKNMGQNSSDSARALVEIISGSTSLGSFGAVSDIRFKNCEFDTSYYYMVYFLGDYITKVKFIDCDFHDNQSHTIQYSESLIRSSQQWRFVRCNFENTKLASSVSSIADFNDASREGIVTLKFSDCYFGPQTVFASEDKICINVHSTWGFATEGCEFDQVSEPFSFGQSNAGAYYKADPTKFALIQNNKFYKIQKSGVDGDSNFFAKWLNNDFIECADFCIGGYSRHWPTEYAGNTFYNCGNNPIGVSAYHQAAIEIVGDGYIVHDNKFIDDQLLTNPTTVATLSQVAGGTLSGRSYYVKYTWVNDTGETLASSEASTAISASNLLKVTLPSLAYPSGAKKINIYVGTSSNAETLQDFIDVPSQIITGETDWTTLSWTEPITGLIAGAALPSSNTTNNTMLYGIYEVAGSGGLKLSNKYYNNHFYGIVSGNEIITSVDYTRIGWNNYTNPNISAGGDSLLTVT